MLDTNSLNLNDYVRCFLCAGGEYKAPKTGHRSPITQIHQFSTEALQFKIHNTTGQQLCCIRWILWKSTWYVQCLMSSTLHLCDVHVCFQIVITARKRGCRKVIFHRCLSVNGGGRYLWSHNLSGGWLGI